VGLRENTPMLKSMSLIEPRLLAMSLVEWVSWAYFQEGLFLDAPKVTIPNATYLDKDLNPLHLLQPLLFLFLF
jgi:hypothetical protein